MEERRTVTVYLPMCLDYIHIGHINILNKAILTGAKKIIIGLVSDEIMDQYKERHHTYNQRMILAYALKGVTAVIPERTQPLFVESIKQIQPDYVIHGDDWTIEGAPLYNIRQWIMEIVTAYGGKLIEPEYTKGVNSTRIRTQL